MRISRNWLGHPFARIAQAETITLGPVGKIALGNNMPSRGWEQLKAPGARDDLNGMPWAERNRQYGGYPFPTGQIDSPDWML